MEKYRNLKEFGKLFGVVSGAPRKVIKGYFRTSYPLYGRSGMPSGLPSDVSSIGIILETKVWSNPILLKLKVDFKKVGTMFDRMSFFRFSGNLNENGPVSLWLEFNFHSDSESENHLVLELTPDGGGGSLGEFTACLTDDSPVVANTFADFDVYRTIN